ncbi:MAG: HAMP domain-containing protein [Planctomycetes bacterium]|nr:HAMP domain-containing protein [Planctomycetota bacterium]
MASGARPGAARPRAGGSIRATLLLWYALILVATMCAFGVVLYSSQRRALERELDDRVRGHARALAAAAEDDAEDGIELELADDYLAAFRLEGEEHPYFVIFDREGRVAIASRPGLDAPAAPETGLRDRGEYREALAAGQDGLLVLAGEHAGGVRRALRDFLALLIGSGAAALALALLGGFWLCGRVLAPIRRMSDAASEVSEANPAHRLNVGATESELGRLAGTLNEAFDRLQAALERQQRFIADASHELRTPVSVVLAGAEHALSREREAADYRETLQSILRAARRMRGLIDGLLTLTQADSASLPLVVAPVPLAALLREAVAFIEPLASARQVALELHGPEATVAGDRRRLLEAFSNLIANAVQYNRPGGRVRIEVRQSDEGADVAVADTGIGIAPEHLPHLFERFYRVDPARGREGGSGLGLAIAEQTVRGHGGTISVASREGEGSTFTVRLPATPGAGGASFPPGVSAL